MFSLDNIKLDELDMFTFETEILLNSQMINKGFNVGNKMIIGNDVFLKYYKIDNVSKNKVVENNIVFQYKTKDMVIYILKEITTEQVTREIKNIKYNESED